MSRLHSTFVALVLAAATAVGLVAVVHSVRLGQNVSVGHVSSVSARTIAVRRARLARWSRSLRRSRAKRPPALPKLPKFAPVQVPRAPAVPPSATPVATTAAQPQVTYVRPKPVVEYHRAQPSSTTTATTGGPEDEGGSDGSGDGHETGGGD